MTPLLEAKNLTISYHSGKSIQKVFQNVSFELYECEIVGLVGESGVGKTTLALSLIDLLPQNAIKECGEIFFQNKPVTCAIRGKEIGLCLQDALASLNPVLTIGYQLREVVSVHLSLHGHDALHYIKEILAKVHIKNPDEVLRQYPHQLSGGMRQRVLLLLTVISKPKVLILDEPTASLDILTERSIINFILELKKEFDLTVLLISHNKNLVDKISDRVLMLMNGTIKTVFHESVKR